MSFDKFQCFYTVEQANDLLEYSDISDDDVDVPEAFLQSQASDNVSDRKALPPQPNCSDDEDNCSSSSEDEKENLTVNPSGQQQAKNGVTWNPLLRARPGQANAPNIFRIKTGVHPAIRNRAAAGAYDCWKLFVDNNMLKSIQVLTCREATKINPDFTLSLDKLEAFIGLQYARGIYGKHHSIDFLWNKTYGPRLFGDTMPRDCFREVKRYIRFDNKDCRSQRLADDKFVHVREPLEKFVANCMFNYTPQWSLTIDEQLFPMKNRCPFIAFMPNKPDKFGMKFWVMTEVESKYVYNLLPYLGAFEKEQRNGKPLAEDVVMRLIESIHNKAGYNVTTDNFFTSVHVASLLQQKKITIVGTVRNNNKGLTKEMTKCGNDMYGSKFYYNEQNECLFVNYQCKKKKNVNLLSTMHNAPSTDNTEKKKTLVIHFYNKNKVGVDVFDQMVRQYTTHSASKRWPLAV